jgi:hypothetical protein
LVATCADCRGEPRRVAVNLVLVRYPDIQVQDALQLLTCRKRLPRAARTCGGKPAAVVLEAPDSSEMRLPVFGPEAV